MAIFIPDVSEMQRVDSDEIYVDYVDRDQYWMWNGNRFTGIAVEMGVDGNLMSETTYADGIEFGPYKTWYWNGQLESEGESKWNRIHGSFKSWYESGQLECQGLAELGYVIWRKGWNEEGNFVAEYRIEDNPTELRSLDAYRSWSKREGVA